jgi:hypothetical protein
MLELAVGLVAGLLVVAGVAIMIGPSLPRRLGAAAGLFRRLGRARGAGLPADSGLHPSTQRTIASASRLASLLRAHGHEEMAIRLHEATRMLLLDEPAGLRALREQCRRAAAVRLPDRASAERQRQLVAALRAAIRDRAEQLEILFR